MNREFDFLLAAVRRFFRHETPVPSSEGLDPHALFDLAKRHSVTLFLARVLPHEAIREGAQQDARNELFRAAELTRLLRAFERDRIQVIPLKGPVLGTMLYGSESLRTSRDLDLLVRPWDALRAAHSLVSSGYRLKSTLHWPVDVACALSRDCQLAFADITGRTNVDLHWRFLPRYSPGSFDEADAWARLRKVHWEGHEVYALTPEYLLLFLVAHGTRHVWGRLGWICDVARLVQVEQRLDWVALVAQTRRTHTSRMLSLALSLASGLLGGSPPPAAAKECQDVRVNELATAVWGRLRNSGPDPAPMRETLGPCLRAFETVAQRIRFVRGVLFWPTEAEYRALIFPPSLHWIYWLVRPLRLIAKYLKRWASFE